jgi:hypothetical protein
MQNLMSDANPFICFASAHRTSHHAQRYEGVQQFFRERYSEVAGGLFGVGYTRA